MEIILAILLGGAFGFVLQRIGATNPSRIWEMLKLTNLKLVKTILLAIGLSTILVFVINAIAPGAVNFSVKAAFLGVFVGGMIFGLGFAIGGLCPGTAVAAMGEGRKDAIFYVVGGLFGAWTFALMFDYLKTTDLYQIAILGGKTTIASDVTRKGIEYNSLIDFMPGVITAIILGIIFIAAAKYAPSAIRKKIDA